MMAILWDDVAADLASAKRHFERAVGIYEKDLTAQSGAADYVSTMAFQHAMQSGYTSFEAGLRRILHLLNEPLPGGPNTHAALLRRVGQPVPDRRPAILDAALLAYAEELRRFRHVAMHSYDDFEPRRAAIPAEAAQQFVAAIDAALARFRTAIDPA